MFIKRGIGEINKVFDNEQELLEEANKEKKEKTKKDSLEEKGKDAN